MNFSFFSRTNIFHKDQTKVPPYLRNYAKTTNHHPEESDSEYYQPLCGLDGTIQGRALVKTENLSPANKHGSSKIPLDITGLKTKLPGSSENVEKLSVIQERNEINRIQLIDMMKVHRATQARVPAPTLSIEPIDSHPAPTGIQCTGQRMGLAETQQNILKKASKPAALAEIKDKLGCEQVVSNGTTNNSHAVSLNKLYSCLKRMKYRRNEGAHYEDLATISMNGREPGFGRNCFQRVLGGNKGTHKPLHVEREEIFMLLGGKSKPVRFEINPEGLNLLEKEWHVELKSRDSVFCNSDEEGLQLLRKFRERFRNTQRALVERRTPRLPIPWARHVVHKGRSLGPQEKEHLGPDDSGRKLSIHVYLPNVGWDDQRNSTPATEIFLPSK